MRYWILGRDNRRTSEMNLSIYVNFSSTAPRKSSSVESNGNAPINNALRSKLEDPSHDDFVRDILDIHQPPDHVKEGMDLLSSTP